jgi:hypothetical protein
MRPVTVKRADTFRGDLVVEFSDGRVVLFPAEFLFGHRDAEPNRVIPPDSDGEPNGWQ